MRVFVRSRLSRAPAVLGAATGLQDHSSAIWENAAAPSSLITLGPGVKREGKDPAEAYYNEKHAGARNAKRIFLADKDTTLIPMSVSPEDAEVLEFRRFSVIELCRLFNVPPPIVQDYSRATFTNPTQAITWFATNTLTPWARKLGGRSSHNLLRKLADPRRFERPAFAFGGQRSIQLSYGSRTRVIAQPVPPAKAIPRPSDCHAAAARSAPDAKTPRLRIHPITSPITFSRPRSRISRW